MRISTYRLLIGALDATQGWEVGTGQLSVNFLHHAMIPSDFNFQNILTCSLKELRIKLFSFQILLSFCVSPPPPPDPSPNPMDVLASLSSFIQALKRRAIVYIVCIRKADKLYYDSWGVGECFVLLLEGIAIFDF